MAVQSRTLIDKRKTTETCELAKSGKRGVVRRKDLLNYMKIIALKHLIVKWTTPCSKPFRRA